jgi:hypothetical protein
VNAPDVSPAVADQVHLLLAANRVVLSTTVPGVALVAGRSGHYVVRATATGVTCTCPAYDRGSARCSHAVASMIRWGEQQAERRERREPDRPADATPPPGSGASAGPAPAARAAAEAVLGEQLRLLEGAVG